MRIEAWVDADGLVRRMRFVKSQPGEGGEGPSTVDMRMDFFDFTHVPEIDVPDRSEVFRRNVRGRRRGRPLGLGSIQ